METYIKNAHGDVVSTYAGSKLNRKYKYEAFGKTVSTSNATGNPFRYAGEYCDEESGMIYLRARYYDQSLGRFINEDPIKDGWNWHTYCENNPVNCVDPSGLDAHFYNNIYEDIKSIKTSINNILEAKLQYEHLQNNYFEDDYEELCKQWSTKASKERTKILNSRLVQSCPELKAIFENVFSGEYGATYQETVALKCVLDDFQIQIADFAFWHPDSVPHGTAISINQGSLSTSFSKNVCFVKDTLILSANQKYIPIQDILIGDYVYSINENTFEKGLKKVKNIFRNKTSELVIICVNNNQIICTLEHPFWVIDKGWVVASELSNGDRLLNYDDSEYRVINVKKIELNQPIEVYNFEVEDWHTYFVADGFLVHNDCLNNKQATIAAEKLGYVRVKGVTSHGQLVFTNGKNYITIDADSHNGGTWKMASSVKNLSSKSTRMGTYDENLVRIGD